MSITSASAGGGGCRALAHLADDHHLTPTERLVLYEIAARIDPATATWRPVACTDWARLLGTTYRTLRAAITSIAERGWIVARFPRGHDGAIEASEEFWAFLCAHVATADPQQRAINAVALVQERSGALAPEQLSDRPIPVLGQVRTGATHTTPREPLSPGHSAPQEGSSSRETLACLTKAVADRLGPPIAGVLLSPANTGARRKADELLASAARALGDVTGEQVIAKALAAWPPATQLRNPAGFLLQRARAVSEWAESPHARDASTCSGSDGGSSPTAYGVALAKAVLAGHQSAEEARYNCDFAFTTDSDREAALGALDTVLASLSPAGAREVPS